MMFTKGKNLHIVTLNVPYPPDYGGMIDCYNRIRCLNNIGININLHCFQYGRKRSTELESLCNSVEYYDRKTLLVKHFSPLPYSVISRSSDRLLKNLSGDEDPILFDGIQTTLYINHPSLSERKKVVRLHNIEHQYYSTLAEFENNLVKRLYYKVESQKLKHYEKVLAKADALLTISDIDQVYFQSRYHNSRIITSFHPFDYIESKTGKGEYLIYHGDLSVNANAAVAEYLITEIFSKIPYRCIIAGKKPSNHIKAKAKSYGNITLITDPDKDEMLRLIKDAHVNILPSFAANGFKLKLLISLFAGRHCLVNSTTIAGTSLDNACLVGDFNKDTIDMINKLMQQQFTEKHIAERADILNKYFNSQNAVKLAELMFT